MLGTLGGYVYLSKGTKELPQLLELSDANVLMFTHGLLLILDLEATKIMIFKGETLEFVDFVTVKEAATIKRGKFQWVCGTKK